MATVTPGIVWASGETVTPTKLNAAATPTVVVANNEITTARILDGAVTNAKIASGLDAAKLTTGTLPAGRIGANAITTARIANAAVTNDKLSLAANAGEVKKALNADNAPPIYACRAWVNFDGTSVTNVGGEDRCAIRSSGNIAKVVRSSAGVYFVHFTTAMPNANYVAVVSGSQGLVANDNFTGCNNYQAGSFSVVGCNTTGSLTPHEDMAIMSVAVFA